MTHIYNPEAQKAVGDAHKVQTTISPITGEPVVKRELPQSNDEIDHVLRASHAAFRQWRQTPLNERKRIVQQSVSNLVNRKDQLARELTECMARPIRYTQSEILTYQDRAQWLIDNCDKSLKDEPVDEGRPQGFERLIRRTPLGVCLLVGAWNFPYMIQVNALIPALLAGNSVILKPSPQTPVVAERILESLLEAGLPKDVCQVMHLTPTQMDYVVAHPLVSFVSFTGSVANGQRVEKTAASFPGPGFKHVGLELGGKDAAYVREDCDPAYAAENIVDGAMFNSGQSCCAVERVYVHEKVYDAFVEECVKAGYVLDDPRKQETTLGPVISLRSAATIRSHIAEAVEQGAKALIDEKQFSVAKEGTTYVAPQVLINVNHSMKVMSQETFGPVMGIMKVSNDDEALKLINDSPYGLTASIWTQDRQAFNKLVDHVETGTVFMNRCDYLDPALPWTGVKDSGRGISLSRFGFDAVTRAKSVHVRLP
ncbi:hypothetical protein OIO90_000890 [Microbotryomycetes sp. JL221]|nr:hypothetical protein OIO90_000890 [Microbotryomycetes sp. JL221]